MYKKVYVQKGCTMKYLISCTGMGLIPMWRPMFYFHKTWLIILLTDARFHRFENSLKVLKEVFCTKKNCIKKRKRDLYSLIFERPLFYFHKTWWMILKKM